MAADPDKEIKQLLKSVSRDDLIELLSQDYCQGRIDLLRERIHNISLGKEKSSDASSTNTNNNDDDDKSELSEEFWSLDTPTPHLEKKASESVNNVSNQRSATGWSSIETLGNSYSKRLNGGLLNSSPASVNSKQHSPGHSVAFENGTLTVPDEHIRFSQVGRQKSFVLNERVGGRLTNVLKGLELHTGVFNTEEQKKIVSYVYNLQRMGRNRQLRARTYTEPSKWKKGKGRITIQFGCCYNYATDRDGNPPGIIRDEEVDPLPPLLKQMIRRLVRWHVLPTTCVPNSCIVNIYDEDDCIPPHIDHHDFLRPFCTVSFLSQCNILFGSSLKVVGDGDFSGPFSMPLPMGSVLILNGNGADIAKHSVPGVPTKRISITFRKMDDSKLPYNYSPEPDLLGITPFSLHTPSPIKPSPLPPLPQPNENSPLPQQQRLSDNQSAKKSPPTNLFTVDKDDFPPLGSINSLGGPRPYRSGST